jgi:predicted nucleic acid-binding protein
MRERPGHGGATRPHRQCRRHQAISLLRRLPLEVDDAAPSCAFDAILDLARLRRLTTYDAGYLDLALRRRLPLATDDAPLRAAANVAGAELLGGVP